MLCSVFDSRNMFKWRKSTISNRFSAKRNIPRFGHFLSTLSGNVLDFFLDTSLCFFQPCPNCHVTRARVFFLSTRCANRNPSRHILDGHFNKGIYVFFFALKKNTEKMAPLFPARCKVEEGEKCTGCHSTDSLWPRKQCNTNKIDLFDL